MLIFTLSFVLHFHRLFFQGDILLIRSGFIHRYQNSTASERRGWSKRKVAQNAGLEQGEHVLQFLWDNHFGAVASDSPTFEVWGRQIEDGKGLLREYSRQGRLFNNPELKVPEKREREDHLVATLH